MIRIVALAMILLWVEDAQGGIVYTSYYEKPCLNECGRHGYGYAWCETVKGWDYCSSNSGYTARGRACQTGCGTVGTDYHWCYDNRGNKNWGYCSTYDDEAHFGDGAIDSRGHHCLQPCHRISENGPYKCLTAYDWGYCKPIPGTQPPSPELDTPSPSPELDTPSLRPRLDTHQVEIIENSVYNNRKQ